MSLTIPDFQRPSDPYVKLKGRPQGQTVFGSLATLQTLTLWGNNVDKTGAAGFDGGVIIESQLTLVPTSRALAGTTDNLVEIGGGVASTTFTFGASSGLRAINYSALLLQTAGTSHAGYVGFSYAVTNRCPGTQTWAASTAFRNTSTMEAITTGTHTAATMTSFSSTPTVSATTGATSTVTSVEGFAADITYVMSGTLTVTDSYGFRDLIHSESGGGTSTYTRHTAFKAYSQVNTIGTVYSYDSDSTTAFMVHAGEALFGSGSDPGSGLGRVMEIERTFALTTNPADAYAAGLEFDPGYSGAQTVTRHNYMNLQTPSLSSTTLTDACVFRFDAAAGTHKAVDAATTKTTPGGVDAWMKINVNGAVRYIPAYVSKTA